MKCVITYRTSEQCGPEDWNVYTKVLYIDPNMSIRDIYFKHFSEWPGTDVNVDLNIHMPKTKQEEG